MTDIAYEKREFVALATFNRPEVLNAFRPSTSDDFFDVLDEVRNDEDVRVLVITGEGRAFCSGEDLTELEGRLDDQVALAGNREELDRYSELTRQIVGLPKTTIAAVNGYALGLGAEIAIACDLRLGSEETRFGFVEAKRALFETNGVTYFLPRLVGYGRAMDLLLTGEMINGKEAHRIGLVTRLSAPDQLIDETIALAQMIAANAPISVRLVKQVLRQTFDRDLDGMMDLEISALQECFLSEDLKEGTMAFREKREPKYRGR